MHIPLQSNLPGHRPEAPDHRRANLGLSRLALKMISVRKQVALKARRSGVQVSHQARLGCGRVKKILPGTKSRLLQPGADLKDTRALRNDHRPGINIAAAYARIDLGHWRGMIESVLAGLERSPPHPAHQVESILAAHHTRCFQLLAHLYRRGARRQIDKSLRLRPEGRKNQPRKRACPNEQQDEKGPKHPRRARTLLSSVRSSAARHSLLLTLHSC
jgi:hypothetical protein